MSCVGDNLFAACPFLYVRLQIAIQSNGAKVRQEKEGKAGYNSTAKKATSVHGVQILLEPTHNLLQHLFESLLLPFDLQVGADRPTMVDALIHSHLDVLQPFLRQDFLRFLGPLLIVLGIVRRHGQAEWFGDHMELSGELDEGRVAGGGRVEESVLCEREASAPAEADVPKLRAGGMRVTEGGSDFGNDADLLGDVSNDQWHEEEERCGDGDVTLQEGLLVRRALVVRVYGPLRKLPAFWVNAYMVYRSLSMT